MRKNIYDNEIIMFSYDELLNAASSRYLSNEECDAIWECLNNAPDELKSNNNKENIGIKIADEIINIMKKWRKKSNFLFDRQKLKNAVLYSLIHDDEFPFLKEIIRTCPKGIRENDFIATYGQDAYDYVQAHKNYSYEEEDPVILDDADIYLYEEKRLNRYTTTHDTVSKKYCNNAV